MKKFICFLTVLLLFTGCGMMDNTPTKKVEALLNKYQTNDVDVLDDLDNVLFSDSMLTDDERNNYREFMKKHYQDMVYKIKEETIDGDSATVIAEITVRDYSEAMNDANEYRLNHANEFDEDNTFASYRLDKLSDVKDTETYTITFHLTKSNNEWKVDPLSSDDEKKLNGLFGVNDVNTYETRNETSKDNKSDVDDNTSNNNDTSNNNASDTTNDTNNNDDNTLNNSNNNE